LARRQRSDLLRFSIYAAICLTTQRHPVMCLAEGQTSEIGNLTSTLSLSCWMSTSSREAVYTNI